MGVTQYKKAAPAATPVAITLASLASSATAARQSDVIDLIDGSYRIPAMIEIDFWAKTGAGTLGNEKAVHLFMSRSVDGTSFEVGPPAIGASNAAFTFANSPLGSAGLPTDLYWVGVLTFTTSGGGEFRHRYFKLYDPPAKIAFVVLNYSGIALSSTGSDHGIQIRKSYLEVVAG